MNLCYVVGTTLLYMNKLSFEDLQKICIKLLDKGYIVDCSEKNICAMLKEWFDFFVVDSSNNILLTRKNQSNKYFVTLIFNSVLDNKIKQDILNSILYRNNQKSKIIRLQ